MNNIETLLNKLNIETEGRYDNQFYVINLDN